MDFSKIKRKSVSYLVISLIFLAIIAASYFRVFDIYELETLDIRFRLRPRLPVDQNIVIIEIGDDTIDKLGQWPISRKYHAAVIDALTKAGAETIVFDVFFSEESNKEADRIFEDAIKNSGKVYLPYVFNIIEKGKYEIPVADRLQEALIDKFKKHAKGTGFINIIPDPDGSFRRVPPVIKYENELYPHVCFLLAANYLGLGMTEMKIEPGVYVKLGDKLKVPLDSNSNIIVNFPGRWQDTFRHYSYIDIIASHVSEGLPFFEDKKTGLDLKTLKGSVCFIGVTATATPDAHPAPFDSLYPGVGVHASLFNSFLINKFIKRATRINNMAILVFLCLVIYWISKRSKTVLSFIFVFLFILGYISLALLAFIAWGLWIDLFYPITAVFFVYLGATFAKYIGETQKIELFEKELSIAKNIQESFLPKDKPDIPGMDIAANMRTARHVGGDLYDFIKLGKDKIGIMIGDVSGKGIPAALYMAKVVSEFKSYAAEELTSRAISKLNAQLLRESGSGLFVTLSYVVFDMDSEILKYSTGGHLPMIMTKGSAGEMKLIDLEEGMPLGLFDGNFGEEKVKFEKGDTFILYTDGVTEAMGPKREMFGEERLLNLVKENISLNATQLVDLIQDRVKAFEGKNKQHDDITVIAVKIV